MTQDAAAGPQSPLGRFLGVVVVEQDETHVRARMPIEERHQNPMGAIHGGAIISLADNTATAMANRAHQDGDGAGPFMVAIDLHAVFLANQQGGSIEAEARVVRRGRRVTVIRTVVTGEQGRPLAEVTTTHVPA